MPNSYRISYEEQVHELNIDIINKHFKLDIMIWFDISKLEDKISRNELSDKDGYNYVLAFFILSVLAMSISSQDGNGWIKLLNCFLLVLITIWGLDGAYKANTEIDGKDFFKRFFAINWVIGMRMLVVAFLFGIVLAIISLAVDTPAGKGPIRELISTIFVSLFSVIYYLLIIKSIRKLGPIVE